ncbi:MAG TPA: M1 family metallopeptidase [Ferruginibacter sp.]|nr:M1 family metallopeptidase [Ferruginibacter sp.]HMP20369.1 M1 family metallopeptidase [Ferruginibacter sp.]
MKNILVVLVFCCTALQAQVVLPITRDVGELYRTGTRTRDGKPGKNYWQNTADYTIAVQYNPATRLVTGTEEIVYYNNSPNPLAEIVFKLYPNLYQQGNTRDMPIDAADAGEGVLVDSLYINGKKAGRIRIIGTNMTVGGLKIEAGKSVKLALKFQYTLNKKSHIRTGEIEENAAFIAYFFPRIAVYDDLDGWNKKPYLGTAEFYNDFCNFDVSVTVPKNFIVWATGDLQNCSEVLTEKYCKKLQAAELEDSVVFIADENEIKAGAVTAANDFNTWRFSAKNVVDFVFAVSDHYVWNASSLVVDSLTGRRTRVDAVFNTAHKDYFEVIHYARQTVHLMSHVFPKWPFPYSHITVFDGLDQMEYPMMINDNPVETKADGITLTVHEIFHTMFPFYMGVNETKYGWMDEGWATLGEWLLSNMIDTTLFDDYGMAAVSQFSGKEQDVPVTQLTTMQQGTAFFVNSYPRPALGYLYVKNMLGDSLFLKGLHYYIKQWNGKHPLPLDFFNCMNTGSGKNLDWFWKKWFYDTGYPDLAIVSVSNTTVNKKIIIESKGNKPVPVDVSITFADGSIQQLHRSIAVWEKGNSRLVLNLSTPGKIKKIELGSMYVPDINMEDNVWQSPN